MGRVTQFNKIPTLGKNGPTQDEFNRLQDRLVEALRVVRQSPQALLDAKGSLISATAQGAPVEHVVGTDGQALIADSTQTTGLRWGSAGPFASILDYGAVSGGTIDSTAAFARAWAVSPIVLVPAGTFLVSNVSIPTGCSLLGVGAAKSILTAPTGAPAILMDGCQSSTIERIRILVNGTSASTDYGIWIKNTTAASQFNRVRDCIILNTSGSPRTAGQHAIVCEDNSASTVAQFWCLIEDCVFFSFDQGIFTRQTGAGADGVNQWYFGNNVEISCLGAMTVGPRTGDHVISGMFGSHSSPSVFTDVVLTVGDAIPSNPNGGAVQAFGLVSDMGANGSAFKIQNHSVRNILIANNESSGTDSNLSDSTSTTIGNKALLQTSRNFNVPSGFFSGTNNFAATAVALTVQETNTRNVADTNTAASQSDRQIIYTSLTAARSCSLPTPGAGNRVMLFDASGNASGVNTISVAGNINGTPASASVAINSAFGSSEWESTASTWFLKSHNP